MTPRTLLVVITIQLAVVILVLTAILIVTRPTQWRGPSWYGNDIHVTVDPAPTDCWTDSGIYTACR